MRGHIRKRSARSWTIVVDIGRDPVSGKRRQKWQTVQGTKRDAERTLRETLSALEKGIYIEPSCKTLSEWLNEWLQTYVTLHTTPRTQESYCSTIEKHLIPALGLIPLTQLKPQHLQDYYINALSNGRCDNKGGLSKRSVLYHHRILSEALSHAVKMGILVRNVAEVADPPRPSHVKMNPLTPWAVSRFLDAAKNSEYYVFFSTLLYTGVRRGELLGLRWRNLDLDFATLHVVETAYKLGDGTYVIKEPKTPHSRRVVNLPPSLSLLLRKYRQDKELIQKLFGHDLGEDDFVFAHPDGRLPDPSAISRAFSRVLDNAGLPHVRLHDLRHTHATLMLKAGVHPKIVSERLGHANINITLDTYSHVLPGLQEAAAERFDKMLEEKPQNEETDVSKMLADGEGLGSRPCRSRTCDTLIKSQGFAEPILELFLKASSAKTTLKSTTVSGYHFSHHLSADYLSILQHTCS